MGSLTQLNCQSWILWYYSRYYRLVDWYIDWYYGRLVPCYIKSQLLHEELVCEMSESPDLHLRQDVNHKYHFWAFLLFCALVDLWDMLMTRSEDNGNIVLDLYIDFVPHLIFVIISKAIKSKHTQKKKKKSSFLTQIHLKGFRKTLSEWRTFNLNLWI